MDSEPMTPADLERELGVPAQQIRNVLRAEYGLLAERGEIRWELTPEQVAHVRRAFQRG
ncbi:MULTISPECIES: hypothetical protein [Isoptericola]|uniref:Uncharacterized protein n=1 Tax=Isoptericola sediminis TaxID=2733572 RepID=A0A849KIR5_9MICO|nr:MULTISPECIES: hypothetical protein [Isoptericola]MDO8148827.1 hypothetical protein [Isoptericola sp. b515]NNU28573.1 hypothetical protein [Isoptericola sediminis]